MDSTSQGLLDGLKARGADFFVTVPCKLSADMITLLEKDPDITHIAATREEEGVGLCAGAALAGRSPVMLIQNSGLGNSVNALCSLTQLYQLPLLILMTHRGTVGEAITAQTQMGTVVGQVLEAINIPAFAFSRSGDVGRVADLVDYARVAQRPVAALLDHYFWRG